MSRIQPSPDTVGRDPVGRPGDPRALRRLGRVLARTTFLVVLAALLLPVPPAAAADAPVMEARAMLQGHARVGAWMAIDVRVRNDGPSIVGELRLAGGAQGRTRFGTAVDLPTISDKTYRLYVQPPAFGGRIEVTLVAEGRTLARTEVAFTVHESAQLVVGVVSERPQGIIGDLDLLPGTTGLNPAIVPLTLGDLPDRVEAWAPLDRLIWQDVDSTNLSREQIEALRGWLAAGGRLVIAGGTLPPAALSSLPDDILPYRPIATIDAAPDVLAGLLGDPPEDATDVVAMVGELARGRALASVGGRAIAAEAVYGSGSVTLLGFDPTSGWIGGSDGAEAVWRRFLPPRSSGAIVIGDDSMLVNAVQQLPALALPPVGGLIALLLGYIALIGPVNYLVLRRLDRREWAWITMPVLIAVFAAGSYGFGAALRGLDVIVNEVAIVRGAPDAREGTAQVYLGIFSPSRGTYQVDVPGGALISSTLAGDFLGGGEAAGLDILQGEPGRIRDLQVNFSSLRTIRAETATTVPHLQADVRLENGRLLGTIRNLSDKTLEQAAIVLGGSVAVLGDLAPRSEREVSLAIKPNQFGQSLSDRILGEAFFGGWSATDDRTRKVLARRAVIDQLTMDPMFGNQMQLPSETPVLLAWGVDQVVDLRIEGQTPRRTGNVLYYVPLQMAIRGTTVFDTDLIRSSLVETDALFLDRNPYSINFGQGSLTMAYRPIQFEGTLQATRVLLGMNFGGSWTEARPQPIEPVTGDGPAPSEEPCDPTQKECFFDGVPQVELFDRSGEGAWVRLPRMQMGPAYELEDPARYVEPATGNLLVRFVNDADFQVSFTFQVRIEGEVQ